MSKKSGEIINQALQRLNEARKRNINTFFKEVSALSLDYKMEIVICVMFKMLLMNYVVVGLNRGTLVVKISP